MGSPEPQYLPSHFENPDNFVTCAECGGPHRVTDYTYFRFFGNAYKGRDAGISEVYKQPHGSGGQGSIPWNTMGFSYILCDDGCLENWFSVGDDSPVLSFKTNTPCNLTTLGAPQNLKVTASNQTEWSGEFSYKVIGAGQTGGAWEVDQDFATNGIFSLKGYRSEGEASIDITVTLSGGKVYTRRFVAKVKSLL